MKYKLLAALLLLSPGLVLAENIGVVKNNYSIGVSHTKFKFDSFDDTTTINELHGLATVPLGQYGGATGIVSYGEYNYSNSDLDTNKTLFGGILFLRDSSLGKAGLTYYDTEYNFDSSLFTSSDISFSTQSNSALFDYYLNDFTIGFERTVVKIDDSSDHINSWALSGLWHINPNALIRVTKYGMDGEDASAFSIIYQPEVFHQSSSFMFRLFRDSTGSIDYKAYYFSFNFYFDTRVSLKDRERKYSHFIFQKIP